MEEQVPIAALQLRENGCQSRQADEKGVHLFQKKHFEVRIRDQLRCLYYRAAPDGDRILFDIVQNIVEVFSNGIGGVHIEGAVLGLRLLVELEKAFHSFIGLSKVGCPLNAVVVICIHNSVKNYMSDVARE